MALDHTSKLGKSSKTPAKTAEAKPSKTAAAEPKPSKTPELEPSKTASKVLEPSKTTTEEPKSSKTPKTANAESNSATTEVEMPNEVEKEVVDELKKRASNKVPRKALTLPTQASCSISSKAQEIRNHELNRNSGKR